jgi:hypothetical protein
MHVERSQPTTIRTRIAERTLLRGRHSHYGAPQKEIFVERRRWIETASSLNNREYQARSRKGLCYMITLYDIVDLVMTNTIVVSKPLLTFLFTKAHRIARDLALCYEASTKSLCAGCIGKVTSHPVCLLGRLERGLRALCRHVSVLLEGPHQIKRAYPNVAAQVLIGWVKGQVLASNAAADGLHEGFALSCVVATAGPDVREPCGAVRDVSQDGV